MASTFDKDEDGTVSLEEFESCLEKYTQAKEIKVEELAKNVNKDIIDDKNLKEVVDQYNESIRKKAVYEDFNIEGEDIYIHEKREKEAL